MRRFALLSGLVLVGGVLGPSAALASTPHDDEQVRWIAVEDEFAVVLPDGTTLTDDPGEGLPPVGARLFLSEKLFATDDGKTRGDEVGRTHVECTAQVVQTTVSCDIAFVLDGGSQLLGSVTLDFSAQDQMQFDIPVTGGSDDFFGATGEVALTDISSTPDETVTLYEVDVVLPHHSNR